MLVAILPSHESVSLGHEQGNCLLGLSFVVKVSGWGTAGSGLATGIAFTTGFAVMAPALLKKSSLVSLRKGRFSFRLLGQMTYNGSSEGLSELSAGITVFLFNWVMMKNWGEVGVAAFTAINYMLNLGVQMFVGLSDGIVPILSFNYGAGHLNRVKETLFLGFSRRMRPSASFCSASCSSATSSSSPSSLQTEAAMC